MANFGVRHAYPLSSRRSGSDARSAAGASRGFLARALGHLLDALDAAPFDLAWPPSAHALSRAGWVPNPAAPAGGALGTRDAAPDAPDARDARDARGAGERGRLRGAA